ncbi:ABC transporter ATP-binding protein [Agrobacterium arsenijevicii]|uniref:ABC transporter ATP-binding protein n=1 Tax=Agrobacterium arsenijevicii TaxID=1585697 RepID=UPI0005D41994
MNTKDTDAFHYRTGPGTNSAAKLAVDGLTVRFQGLAAISNVSFMMERHEIFGLIGPNGAGKTTLVNCLTGFQKPTEGRVLLGRQDTSGWRPTIFRRNGVARTFQAGRLFKDMSVLDNVRVTAVALGASNRLALQQSMEVLSWIGLANKATDGAGSLAYTDQRRLSIARAMVLNPAFVLLDEPAAGMSDAETEELMALIAAIPSDFKTGVLLIEHNMHMVMSICNRVHVLDGGKTLAVGTPDEIKRHQDVIKAYLGGEE